MRSFHGGMYTICVGIAITLIFLIIAIPLCEVVPLATLGFKVYPIVMFLYVIGACTGSIHKRLDEIEERLNKIEGKKEDKKQEDNNE